MVFKTLGCADGTVSSALYLHAVVLDSVPGRGKIYMENLISTAHPAHSAVMSRPGLYLVEGKAANAVTGHRPLNAGP